MAMGMAIGMGMGMKMGMEMEMEDTAYADSLFLKFNGLKMDRHTASKYIRYISERLCDKVLGPVILRKLRITHSLDLIKVMSNDSSKVKLMEMEIAASGGHTVDVMNEFYKLKDKDDLIKESKEIVNYTNRLLFNSLIQTLTLKPDSHATNNNINSLINSSINKQLVPPNRYIDDFECSKAAMESSISQVINDEAPNICTRQNHVCLPHTTKKTIIRMNYVNFKNIQCPSYWLTDTDIDYACIILKNQFPHINGLVNPQILLNLKSDNIANKRYNFYIIFDGLNHWVCAATYCYSKFWYVYDSLTPYKSSRHDRIEKQLNAISPFKRNIVYANCPLQENGDDCGVYAIAIIVDLIYDKNPELRSYIQIRMRNHLHKCLAEQKFTSFPSIKKA